MKKNCKDCKRMECFQIAKVHSQQNTTKKSTQLCVHIENCNSKRRVALCFTFYCLMLIKSVWLAVVKISVEKSRYVLGNVFLDKFLTFSKSLIGRLVNSFMWFVIQPFSLLLSNDKKINDRQDILTHSNPNLNYGHATYLATLFPPTLEIFLVSTPHDSARNSFTSFFLILFLSISLFEVLTAKYFLL